MVTVFYVRRPRISWLSDSVSGHNSDHDDNNYYYGVLTMHQGKIACLKTSRERNRAELNIIKDKSRIKTTLGKRSYFLICYPKI